MTEALFRPFTLRGLTLANRIVMAPMTRASSPDGVPGPANAAYYARRAAGGVGLIITEGTCVDRPGSWNHPNYPHIFGDAAIEGWRRVVEAVHAEGGRIALQLWHVGGFVNQRMPDCNVANLESPSGHVGKAMDDADIAATLDAYGRGAATAKQVGFDAVEIHAAHGYLLDQFLWVKTNKRKDKWGGSAEKRTAFPAAVVGAVRQAVGPDMPVLFRWSQWKQQDYDAELVRTPHQLRALMRPIEAAGADAIHCSQRRYWEPSFPSSELNLAGWVKRLTGLPTIAVGSIGLDVDLQATLGGTQPGLRSIQPAIERLAADEFDLLALGRTLIANPDWPNLVREGKFEALQPFNTGMLASLD
jgi:2,4-dienoyl-CoA reductase-like NADH-dependent reductase (Old Yellow Enzyme family)